jgi:hypothetical protein
MNKDSLQKQKAIRFCVATGVVPYLEVLVRYVADVAEVEADISDIDVLGLRPPALQPSSRILFDCKTLNKVSAISRAMWAAGLMRLVHADESYVILNRAAPEGHRLAANELGVRLTSELLFDDLGKLASPTYSEGFTYLDNLEAWGQLAAVGKLQPNMVPMTHFLFHTAPLERDATRGLRALIQALKHAEGEFDISKPAHKALWGLLVCEAIRLLSEITAQFHHIFDPAMSRDKFETLLRNYVWGGREAYVVRQRLHNAIRTNRAEHEISAFELPGWERFVELMRGLLDAPHLVGSAILPLKDKAFAELCIARAHADQRIKQEFSSNPRARQFAIQVNRYLGSLSKLLKDCSDHYAGVIAAA